MKVRWFGGLFASFLILLLAVDSKTAEFRPRNPIMSPGALPAGTRPVAEFRPVDRAVVERAIKRLFAACCADIGALDAMISDDFANKSRVLDNFVERFPRDTKVKFLGMQGVQTLNQHIEPAPDGTGEILVSTVSAVVRSELQFNDTEAGFTKLPGTVEYFFRVKQKMP